MSFGRDLSWSLDGSMKKILVELYKILRSDDVEIGMFDRPLRVELKLSCGFQSTINQHERNVAGVYSRFGEGYSTGAMTMLLKDTALENAKDLEHMVFLHYLILYSQKLCGELKSLGYKLLQVTGNGFDVGLGEGKISFIIDNDNHIYVREPGGAKGEYCGACDSSDFEKTLGFVLQKIVEYGEF